jgi:uncharacterized protein YbaR (Trm112 family)
MFNESASPFALGQEFDLPLDKERKMEYILCPFCHGDFAVDAYYLDEISDVIHCPMCCMEVFVLEEDGNAVS